jgi:hypothetical protein
MPKKRLLNDNLSQLSSRSQLARTRALHALSLMRQGHLSLAEACHLEHIKPATVLRYVGSAVRQERPGGRYRATKSDRFRRDLQIPTASGQITITVSGSKAATEIAEYQNAVARYLRKGDASKLKRFQRKMVGIRGQRVELVTDPTILSSLAQAGALQFDQLYASIAGR